MSTTEVDTFVFGAVSIWTAQEVETDPELKPEPEQPKLELEEADVQALQMTEVLSLFSVSNVSLINYT